jgi:hypothetical protein
MTEVCEEYFLHRETLHLAAAYFDRFMTEARGIKRTQVQLVGVTALFVAAKLEEIYPPRVGEFAKVCDGACTIDDILGLEVHMLDVSTLFSLFFSLWRTKELFLIAFFLDISHLSDFALAAQSADGEPVDEPLLQQRCAALSEALQRVSLHALHGASGATWPPSTQQRERSQRGCCIRRHW